MPPTQTAQETSTADSLPDRILLDRNYDVERLQGEVNSIVSSLTQQFYIYYHAVELLNDTIKDPRTHDWMTEPMLEGCSYLHEIFANFETEITSVRLMRLEAGADVKEHCDPTLDAAHREVVRLTLPIFSDDQVTFFLNKTEVPMKPGELWYMKLSERHSVHNNSQYERINMSIDVMWNDWVGEWLATNAGG